MRDQASSLRELKAQYQRLVARPKQETPKDFLASLKRQSPLSAVVLVYPDKLQVIYPDMSLWLNKIIKNPDKTLLWDQANILKNPSSLCNNQDDLRIKVLPRQPELLTLQGRSDSARYDFLKEMANRFNSHNEVWITIKASEIAYYHYLISAVSNICVMIPDSQEAIINCYESIKNIHKIKNNLDIFLLDFSSKPFVSEERYSARIKNVAKQFLGIDLTPMGVVLSSGRYFPQINEGGLLGVHNSTDSACGDFMYTFSESIVYNSLGMN